MTDTVMVALRRDAASDFARGQRNVWHLTLAEACREALARPTLPEGTPQVGWSMDGYPLVWGSAVPDQWQRRCEGTREDFHGPSPVGEFSRGVLFAVRPTPQPATERIAWHEAIGRRTPDGQEVFAARRYRADKPEIGTDPGWISADADGTVEVLVEDDR